MVQIYERSASDFEAKIRKESTDEISYLMVTDLHYSSGASTEIKNAIHNQMNLIADMANRNPAIDFVVVGGDITTGMYKGKEPVLSDIDEVLKPLKGLHKPVFIMPGNHDDNSYHVYWETKKFFPEMILSEKDWRKNLLEPYCPNGIHPDSMRTDSKYYYYDFPDYKVRAIFLDANQYEYKADENGTITELIPMYPESPYAGNQYRTGTCWWGYSACQMQWLIREALQAPLDWNYLFFSHMGIDEETNVYDADIQYGDKLRKIIRAVQNKTLYNDSEIGTADFSRISGEILLYHCGHTHTELMLYSDDIKLWQVITGTPNPAQTPKSVKPEKPLNTLTLDWRFYPRAFGTVSEACFDGITVSRTLVKKVSFGAGGDYRFLQNF